ncbi:hypothetical protein DICA1_D11606 [Diutina catenulata]
MSTSPLPKTCVIVTNLDKNDFVAGSHPVSVAEQIKVAVLADHSADVEYWSTLPNLSRIIIILTSEQAASDVHNLLNQQFAAAHPHLKVVLQENLLSRSKSFDGVLSCEEHANQKRTAYAEPTPHQFNAIADLSKMGIDVSDYNSRDEMEEWQQEQNGTPLRRGKSLTKTLFRPLDTEAAAATGQSHSPPGSPTITLDEFPSN